MADAIRISARQLSEYCESVAYAKNIEPSKMYVRRALKTSSVDNTIDSITEWTVKKWQKLNLTL